MIDGVALGDRPAGDILSRTVRVTLGGREYALAVLFIAGNERWRAYQDERTAAWMATVDEADDMNAIVRSFGEQTEIQLDLLLAYDTDCGRRPGVLPDRDTLRESLYDDEPEAALREVVKAANPKAAARLAIRTPEPSTSESSPPTSMPSRRGASRRRKSASN